MKGSHEPDDNITPERFAQGCRAKHAFGSYFDCLNERRGNCRFAYSFAGGQLCRHPLVQQILARSAPDSRAKQK